MKRNRLGFRHGVILVGILFFLMFIPLQADAAESSNWAWPTSVTTLRSDYPYYSSGSYHGGTDFGVSLNSPVYSTCDGEVVAVTTLTTSYGKHIKIKATVNGSTVYMRYCHLNSFAVSVGEKVTAGQLIGYSGSTGNSTGPHLHYEVRDATDKWVSGNLNPRNYLPGTSYTYTTTAASHDPTGVVDSVTSGVNTVSVAGWAFDPDNTSASIDIHVYIGGSAGASGAVGVSIGQAAVYRSDVNGVYGISGNHGFNYTIDVSNFGLSGNQPIYIYAINTGEGTNSLIGQSTVNITVQRNPVGCVDKITYDNEKLTVTGWVYDPDTPSESVTVHVYIGLPAGSSGAIGVNIGKTSVTRTDVNNVYGISGAHGFNYTIDISSYGLTGTQAVYVYGINTGSGSNTEIGQKNVTVNQVPQGYVDSVKATGAGLIEVTGWAFDPDTTGSSVSVIAYIGGKAGESGAYKVEIGATSKTRSDVNEVYGISGTHGFSKTIDLTDSGKSGSNKVYLYAVDSTSGALYSIGNKTVEIVGNSSPVATLDSASGHEGSLVVSGWAFDPDSSGSSVSIHIYIGNPSSGGTLVGSTTANSLRSDVNSVYGISGNHGFSCTIDLRSYNLTGSQKVYVYAIDLSGRKNSLLSNAPKTVDISSPFTISYDSNGGAGAPSAQTKAYGISQTLSSTIPTREYYKFVCWNTKADGSGTNYSSGSTYKENASVTLYAQWDRTAYAVTFDVNGGTGAPSSQSKLFGEDLTLSGDIPVRSGYEFAEWNTNADGSGTSYAPGSIYSADEPLTLFAQWETAVYTVEYNANGGTGAPDDQSKTYGEVLTLDSTEPTRAGHSFVEWNTKKDGSGTGFAPGSEYSNDSSVILYAQWLADTYAVTYDANGGAGAPSAQVKTYGISLTLSDVIPEKTGYTFMGWSSLADGTGNRYNVGSSYSDNAAVTFYAVWEINTYTVTYDANGGTNEPSSQTKTFGTDLVLRDAVPERANYVFAEWNTAVDGTGESYQAGDTYDLDASVTLYAQWSDIPVERLSLNRSSMSLAINGSSTLTTSVTPSNATNSTVTWQSSDTAVATISSEGIVTAISTGTATITASVGEVSASCEVMVFRASDGSTVDNITWTIDYSGNLIISGTGDMQDYTHSSIPWADYMDKIKTVVIEEGVTSIGAKAFWACESLKSVSIPDGVTSIGDEAFYDCIALQSVNIPDSVIHIGEMAFAICSSLKTITIPEGVISIDDYAFCFCESVKSITVPASVTFLGTGVFSGCTALTEFSVDEDNADYSSDNMALFDKAGTTLIAYYGHASSYSVPDGITDIASNAFFVCSSLSDVVLADSVKNIGTSAFSGCRALTGVTLGSGVSYIGSGAFQGCISLTKMTIPENVKSICGKAIGYDALNQVVDGFVISGYIGSAAETYADNNGITFESLGIITHDHRYSNGEFDWAEDYSACTLTLTCKYEDDEEIVDCAVTEAVISASCTEDGKITYTATATYDGKVWSDSKSVTLAATGHDWTEEYTLVKEAACTEEGSEVICCSICGEIQDTRTLAATGHTYSAPIFTWSEDYSECIAVISCEKGDDDQTADCTVTRTEKSASCEEDGETVYTASVSFHDEIYTDSITITEPTVGHIWEEEYTVDEEAGCTSDGSRSIHCSVCDAKKDVEAIHATGHTYNTGTFEWSEDYTTCELVFDCEYGDDEQRIVCDVQKENTEPTCTEEGETRYIATAEFYGKEYTETKTVAVDAAGHNWEEGYTIDVNATCTGEGIESVHCANCDATKNSREVPAKGHIYGTPIFEWEENASSCVAVFTCEDEDSELKVDCEITENVNSSACMDEGLLTYIASCTLDGITYSDSKSYVIAATGHDWEEEYTVDLEPTCTEEGSKSIHCSRCGETKDSISIPALGHSYEYMALSESAHQVVCTVCGETYTEAHTFQNGTCTVCGSRQETEGAEAAETENGSVQQTEAAEGNTEISENESEQTSEEPENGGSTELGSESSENEGDTGVTVDSSGNAADTGLTSGTDSEQASDVSEEYADSLGSGQNGTEKTAVSAVGSVYTTSTGSYMIMTSSEDSRTVTMTAPISKSVATVTIPANVSINGVSYKVTGIAASAFANCSKLTKVVIGKNVVTIGEKAFANCKRLKTVTFKTKILEKIGAKAFKGDVKLTSLTLKSTMLSKRTVKNALKGSSIKLITTSKKLKASYKKYFTKANSGVKVKIS